MESSDAPKRFPDPLEQPCMTVPEAGRWLGLSKDSAYKAAQDGRIPTERFGRRRIVSTAWLAELLQIRAGQGR